MVSIRGISVTSNIFKQLVRAYVEPQYIGHFQTKFKWQDSVVNIIAWKNLALAIDRMDRSVLITKICNGYLPTNTYLKKLDITIAINVLYAKAMKHLNISSDVQLTAELIGDAASSQNYEKK